MTGAKKGSGKESTRLWDKGDSINEQAHRFTVGDDPIIDLDLVRWDAIGSAAQARMLAKIDVLSKEDCKQLLAALAEVVKLADAGKFQIPYELEDCHTAIETFLTERCGAAGAKIHTGRSRNDQVLLAARLYIRDHLVKLLGETAQCVAALLKRYDEVGQVPMPGYTHMQPAMPSSVGMWLQAYVEGFLETIREGLALLDLIDANPLGVGSGFGVPLPLDREYTTKLLGFARAQRCPIDVMNSRGRFELKVLRWCSDVVSVVEKMALDLLLFSMKEFGYFALPREMTTGSSIMPQKANPDSLELLRGRAAQLRAAEEELRLVIIKMPSSYHRDFQYTKPPTIRAIKNLHEILPIVRLIIESFEVRKDRLAAAMSPDLYVTYDAFRQVRAGVPFRDAYKLSADRMKQALINYVELKDDFGLISAIVEKETGESRKELEKLTTAQRSWATKLMKMEQEIF